MIMAWRDSHRPADSAARPRPFDLHTMSRQSICIVPEGRLYTPCRRLFQVSQRAFRKTPSLRLRLRLSHLRTDSALSGISPVFVRHLSGFSPAYVRRHKVPNSDPQ